MMNLTALLADAAGGSHFVELALSIDSVTPGACPPRFGLSTFAAPAPVRIISVPAEVQVLGFHTVPERHLTIALDGDVEYETTDGERRRFGPGQPVLVADLTGRGHVTRFAPGEQRFLHIPTPDAWPAPNTPDHPHVA